MEYSEADIDFTAVQKWSRVKQTLTLQQYNIIQQRVKQKSAST